MDCDVTKCKAVCCGFMPIPNALFKRFIELIKKKYRLITDLGMCIDGYTYPLTYDCTCVFLDESFRCMIYDNRPLVCRRFGEANEIHPLLHCKHTNKQKAKEAKKIIDKMYKAI